MEGRPPKEPTIFTTRPRKYPSEWNGVGLLEVGLRGLPDGHLV